MEVKTPRVDKIAWEEVGRRRELRLDSQGTLTFKIRNRKGILKDWNGSARREGNQ